MGFQCVVPTCRSGYKSNKERVSLFRVPQSMLDAWNRVIPRTDRKLTPKDHVCEKHFHEYQIIREIKHECYTIKYRNPKLVEGAIPTQFLGCPSDFSETVKPRGQLKRERCSSPLPKKLKLDDVNNFDTEIGNNGSFESVFNLLWEKGTRSLTLPSKSWGIHLIQNDEHDIIQFSEVIATPNNTVTKKKILLYNGSIKFYIFDHLCQHPELNDFSISSIKDIQNILNEFNKNVVCYGATGLDNFCKTSRNTTYKTDTVLNVWRHEECKYIIQNDCNTNVCCFCKRALESIKRMKRRQKSSIVDSTVLKLRKYECKRKLQSRLKNKTKALLEELKEVKSKMREVNEQDVLGRIENSKALSSSQKILIKECLKCCKYNKKSSRRYTSEWLLLCLLLHIKSPDTYKFLRNNNIMPLPCISTVRKYLSRDNLKCGLDEQFFEAFKIKMNQKSQFQKHGLLIFDEMQVRPSDSLNVKTMELAGIQDFEDNSNYTCKSSDKQVDHALVFMFSSLTESDIQPVAVYTAQGATSGTCLAQLVLELVKKIEQAGAMLHGIVCDGATTNRKMWTEFGISGKMVNPVHKIIHPTCEGRYLYFFADTPHLIKCLRDRFLQNKVLHPPEGTIKWDYYEHLFNLDSKLPNNLRVCPKLTAAHICPNNSLKMRVELATQIFSKSAADGLLFHKKNTSELLEGCEHTTQFTKRINDLFDALNRRFPAEGIREGSHDFEILKSNMEWLNSWEQMVEDGKITKEQFMTENTAEGFRVTLLSTIELAQNLLTEHSFPYVLTGKMNQDPLEVNFE